MATTQAPDQIDRIAARIAALREPELHAAIGDLMRALAPRHRGRDVVMTVAIYGRVAREGGVVLTTYELLGIETGLTRRATTSALSALERAGVALCERIDHRRVRITLPGLLRLREERGSATPGQREPEKRIFH